VTRVYAQTVSAIDLTSGQLSSTVTLPAEPYTCVVSADGRELYVSLWGGASVAVFSAPSLTPIATLPMAEHPSAMALSADGKRLFVASGSSSSVWVFDTFSFDALEQISMSLFPQAPPTATPNSLALSPDGQTLLVANADNNDVAVVDVNNAARSFVRGFIPTGWYPTGAIFSRDGKQIFVLSGRGLAPASNPLNRDLEKRLTGAVSVLPTPDTTTLNEFSRTVRALAPYSDTTRLSPANAPVGTAIPRVVGGRASCCSTTSTSTPRSAQTGMRFRRPRTRPTSSRRHGRPTRAIAADDT
jgi:YVTN family beta-propeller protein